MPNDLARDGYQDLAEAVIRVAVKDAKYGKLPALAWFYAKGDGLAFWCDVLGLDPDILAEQALRVIEGKKRLSREARVAKIKE